MLVEITHAPEGGLVKIGDRIVVSLKRWPALEQELKIGGIVHASVIGRDLAGTVARHPLHGKGYDFDVPLLAGDFVTDEDGTGFVHIAPGHGADDFVLGRKHNIPVPDTVAGDGAFLSTGAAIRGQARVPPQRQGRRRQRRGDRGADRAPARCWGRASSPIPIRIPGAPRRR